MVDKKRAETAVRELIAAMGEDAEREGLKETPARVARMLEELTAGYADSAKEHLSKTFEECEHHLMPFFGHVHIAYVPCGRVAGLSKLARTVDVFARRLQLQERMNADIADAIFEHLAPKGVAVVVDAEHTCMTARGVKKIGSSTVTYAVRGEMDPAAVAMLLAYAGEKK